MTISRSLIVSLHQAAAGNTPDNIYRCIVLASQDLKKEGTDYAELTYKALYSIIS